MDSISETGGKLRLSLDTINVAIDLLSSKVRRGEPDAYSFDGWLGVPIVGDSKEVAKALYGRKIPSGQSWIFAKNTSIIASINQPNFDFAKSPIKPDSFDGWIGAPINDFNETAAVLIKYQPKARSVWIYSRNPQLISDLLVLALNDSAPLIQK